MAILGKSASFLGASAFLSLRTVGSQPCSRVCHPWAGTNSNDLQPMHVFGSAYTHSHIPLDPHTHTRIHKQQPSVVEISSPDRGTGRPSSNPSFASFFHYELG